MSFLATMMALLVTIPLLAWGVAAWVLRRALKWVVQNGLSTFPFAGYRHGRR